MRLPDGRAYLRSFQDILPSNWISFSFKAYSQRFFQSRFPKISTTQSSKMAKVGKGKNECLKDLITFKTSMVFPRRLHTLPDARIYFPREALNEMLCPQTIGPSIFDEVVSLSTSFFPLRGKDHRQLIIGVSFSHFLT